MEPYLIRELRSLAPNTIIIAITAYPGVLKDAKDAGAWAAVTKNLRRQELIELIQEASSSRSKTRREKDKSERRNSKQSKPPIKKRGGLKINQSLAIIISAIITAIVGGYFAIQAATKPVELQIAATQTAEARRAQSLISTVVITVTPLEIATTIVTSSTPTGTSPKTDSTSNVLMLSCFTLLFLSLIFNFLWSSRWVVPLRQKHLGYDPARHYYKLAQEEMMKGGNLLSRAKTAIINLGIAFSWNNQYIDKALEDPLFKSIRGLESFKEVIEKYTNKNPKITP